MTGKETEEQKKAKERLKGGKPHGEKEEEPRVPEERPETVMPGGTPEGYIPPKNA